MYYDSFDRLLHVSTRISLMNTMYTTRFEIPKYWCNRKEVVHESQSQYSCLSFLKKSDFQICLIKKNNSWTAHVRQSQDNCSFILLSRSS